MQIWIQALIIPLITVLFTVCGLAALVLAYAFGHAFFYYRRSASAKILSSEYLPSSSRAGDAAYACQISFLSHRGEEIETKEEVETSLPHEVGETLKVWYHPDRPKEMITRRNSLWIGVVVLVFIGISFLFGSVIGTAMVLLSVRLVSELAFYMGCTVYVVGLGLFFSWAYKNILRPMLADGAGVMKNSDAKV